MDLRRAVQEWGRNTCHRRDVDECIYQDGAPAGVQSAARVSETRPRHDRQGHYTDRAGSGGMNAGNMRNVNRKQAAYTQKDERQRPPSITDVEDGHERFSECALPLPSRKPHDIQDTRQDEQT